MKDDDDNDDSDEDELVGESEIGFAV